jgi:hypothetical protein
MGTASLYNFEVGQTENTVSPIVVSMCYLADLSKCLFPSNMCICHNVLSINGDSNDLKSMI